MDVPNPSSGRPMVAVHVASGDLWAGAEAQVALLLPALARLGVDTHALLFNEGRLAEELRTAGVGTRVVPESGGTLPLVTGLREALHALDPTVVHTHGYKEAILGFGASLGMDCLRLRTLHGVPELPVGGSARRQQLWSRLEDGLERVLGVEAVAVSRALAEAEQPRWGERLHRIPNAVDAEALAGARADPPPEPDHPRLLFAGRLEPVKGPDLLLEAFVRLHRERPALRLWMAGAGSLGPALAERVRQAGLEEAVRLLGERDDVPSLLAGADLVILPSRAEGMPTLLLEALALGRPVVATAVGGMPEVAEDGRCARLVPPEDPEALARACGELLDDDDERRALAERGPLRVAAHYLPARCAEATLALYRSLAARRSGGDAAGPS